MSLQQKRLEAYRRQAARNESHQNRLAQKIQQEEQIKQALAEQKRKDDIILDTEFEDINRRRRKARVDTMFRSILSRAIDGLDEKDLKIVTTSLRQIKEMALGEEASDEVIGQIRRATKNLLRRSHTFGFTKKERTAFEDDLKEISIITDIKNEKPEDFVRRIKLLEPSAVEDLGEDELKMLAVHLGIDPSLDSKSLFDEVRKSERLNTFLDRYATYDQRVERIAKQLFNQVLNATPTSDIDRLLRNNSIPKLSVAEAIDIRTQRRGRKAKRFRTIVMPVMRQRVVHAIEAQNAPSTTPLPEDVLTSGSLDRAKATAWLKNKISKDKTLLDGQRVFALTVVPAMSDDEMKQRIIFYSIPFIGDKFLKGDVFANDDTELINAFVNDVEGLTPSDMARLYNSVYSGERFSAREAKARIGHIAQLTEIPEAFRENLTHERDMIQFLSNAKRLGGEIFDQLDNAELKRIAEKTDLDLKDINNLKSLVRSGAKLISSKDNDLLIAIRDAIDNGLHLPSQAMMASSGGLPPRKLDFSGVPTKSPTKRRPTKA